MKETNKDSLIRNRLTKRIYLLIALSVLLPLCGTVINSEADASAESIPIYLTQNSSDIDVTKDDTIPKDNMTLSLTNDEGIVGHMGILALSIVGLALASAYAISVHRKSKNDSA